MMNKECARSYNVVKALEALAAEARKLPPLSRNDSRLIAVFDAIVNGADSTYNAREIAILTRLKVPSELYTARARRKPARASAKRAPRKASKAKRK